jgi:hypothetical protein
MLHISLLRLVRYRATHSINIPRLWRSGIRDFANRILFTEGSRLISLLILFQATLNESKMKICQRQMGIRRRKK